LLSTLLGISSRPTFGAKIELFIVEYTSQLNSERALLA
jgi:hypothetical protein